MKTINLRDFYKSLYDRYQFCEVPDEVAELLLLYKRREEAQRRKIYRHKAQYSLDQGEGIEKDILRPSRSAEESYEAQIVTEALYTAMKSLTSKQRRRLYAHYFLDMSYARIASMEGVDESAVRETINTALHKIEKIFHKFLECSP